MIQAFLLALKASSLEMVQQFVDWGMPLSSGALSQALLEPLKARAPCEALHVVCELVDRENFSNSWRILVRHRPRECRLDPLTLIPMYKSVFAVIKQ